MNNLNFGLLISGKLGLKALNHLSSSLNISFILTDKESEEVMSEAKNIKIPVFVGNIRKKKEEIKQFLSDKPVDYIFSISYLFIVDHLILNHPSRHAINLHGSLLPKYRGRTPHVWSIINGENKTGITAHIMDEGCDTGDIIKQVEIPINPLDTGADLLNKYIYEYPHILDSILKDIENNNLSYQKQDNSKATFFGKRTPEDGMIDWNWHKERIRNWVRAQSYPYPGAFSFYGGKKVIIDEMEFSETGFSYQTLNGTIIENQTIPVVKTPNGAVRLTRVRDKETFAFKTDTHFDQ